MKLSSQPAHKSDNPINIPQSLPLLKLKDLVVFPNVVVPLVVRDSFISRLEEFETSQKPLVAVAYPEDNEDGKGILRIGIIAQVLKMIRMKDSSIRLLIQGLQRVDLGRRYMADEMDSCMPTLVKDTPSDSSEYIELRRNLIVLFRDMVALTPNLSDDLLEAAHGIENAGLLADFIAANVDLPIQEKKQIISSCSAIERAQLMLDILVRERNLLELSKKIQSKVKSELDKDQREYYLREQLKVIRKELGEDDHQRAEYEKLEARIREADLSDEARSTAQRELLRLRHISPAAAEYGLARTYLEWILSLPWKSGRNEQVSIENAQRVLDEDHFGLDDIKERIIEFLAVRQLRKDNRGPILCLSGPPGVGKTSLGRSVARALNRPFCRIALGGIHDEAEIRGHRRTYIGSLPGRIIQLLRRVGVNNPVVLLDELDKTASSNNSAVNSALLEVLDPEQNSSFTDNYLEIPFDLSQIFFIATANMVNQVPPALRDRLEVMEISGYTPNEKREIALRHLLPRQLDDNGLTVDNFSLESNTLKMIIDDYTNEAGVRNLERKIASIARKVAVQIITGENNIDVNTDNLKNYLGNITSNHSVAEREPSIGVSTALAWTSAGGEILFVETLLMPGRSQLELTGQLGEIMRESAIAAHSYLKANSSALNIDPSQVDNNDIHIHIPAGATPKDGPSAGLALITALASTYTGRPVRCDLAMTGEITLRGKVLPVGGVKEKSLAAFRAGIHELILPADNKPDIQDIPAEVRDRIKFHLVDNISEALDISLI